MITVNLNARKIRLKKQEYNKYFTVIDIDSDCPLECPFRMSTSSNNPDDRLCNSLCPAFNILDNVVRLSCFQDIVFLKIVK